MGSLRRRNPRDAIQDCDPHETSRIVAVMTMVDALLVVAVDQDKWCCPVGMRETGHGYCYHPERGYLIVPSLHGGHRAVIPSPGDVAGEWEVFDPSEV